MNNFLPVGYQTPEVPSKYMEFAEGINSFRILSSAIVGYEWWTETGNGRKPVRVQTAEEIPAEVLNSMDKDRRVRHFWAFTVYNYKAKAIQVLVVKQQTIMRAIEAFVDNPKWGNPLGYDLIVEKTRTGARERDVEYSTMPEPKAPLDPGIAELAAQMPVRLEALYAGEDPFAEKKPNEEAFGMKNGRARRVR